ncbi:MAG: hypothetical protein ACD_46C00544G0001, partial [uncultured bacterium]
MLIHLGFFTINKLNNKDNLLLTHLKRESPLRNLVMP